MEELHTQWAEIKDQEGKKEQEYFPDKDLHNPSLNASYKIGKRSQKIDFDWDTSDEVFQKVEEEFNELKESLSDKSKANP